MKGDACATRVDFAYHRASRRRTAQIASGDPAASYAEPVQISIETGHSRGRGDGIDIRKPARNRMGGPLVRKGVRATSYR